MCEVKAILLVAEFKPLNERAFFNGMLGAMYSLASVAGPLMGGAFTGMYTLVRSIKSPS
jgi:MFS family permease